ncbi:hypothetical protein HanXRQr2_Chr16g0735471 [Helianthus annuus]|uniref:Uncharacterized protein n=1 Tax=Helianthus annuus TaxID=4232 RepID=A0A9K3DNW3_HELAN|nr:hypothetical protein HanXRQr2_Chr16g0735471 [Helianthus annuus]
MVKGLKFGLKWQNWPNLRDQNGSLLFLENIEKTGSKFCLKYIILKVYDGSPTECLSQIFLAEMISLMSLLIQFAHTELGLKNHTMLLCK